MPHLFGTAGAVPHPSVWPELVEVAPAWCAEERRCEGINRGEIVPVARMRYALREQRRADK